MSEVIRNTKGAPIPLFLADFETQSINAAAFAPTGDRYVRHGFLVRPLADMTLSVITQYQYELNKKSITGLTPVSYFCVANEWVALPLAWVAQSAGVTLHIGIIA